MTVVQRLTVNEYLRGDYPPHTQLLDGRVVVNEPTVGHQRLWGRLYRALSDWQDSPQGSGEVTPSLTLVMGQDSPAPDVMWFAEPLSDEDAPQTLRVPELVVEVRSPSTWAYDRGHKRALYERHGVAECWLVDDSSQTVLRLARSTPDAPGFDSEREFGAGDALCSLLLPAFELAVSDLFARSAP